MNSSDECRLPDTHTTLSRLCDVISNKDSVDQVDRQLILLDTFLTVTGDSVNAADLHLLIKVMVFLTNKMHVNPCYTYYFQRILGVLKHPPKMAKSSDEINYKHYLIESFTALGYFLLKINNSKIRYQILEIVLIVLLRKRSKKLFSLPMRVCMQCIEVSEFMECLAGFVAISEDDLYHWAIYTALLICSVSKLCCWSLLTQNIVETLLLRVTMVKNNEKADILDTTYLLLTKLFKCTNNSEDWIKIPVPSKLALCSLRCILREEAIVHAHPGQRISGLTNISTLILKMMHLFPTAEYVASGLIEDVIISATLTEAVIPVNITPYFKNEESRLRFKNTMLACLALTPICSSSMTLLRNYKVAQCLVTMLDGQAVSWSHEVTYDLFRNTVLVISTLYEHLIQEFINAGLMERLIRFLTMNYLEEVTFPCDLFHAVLKTVMSICSLNINVVVTQNALREANAVSVLLCMCKNTLKPDFPLIINVQSILFHSLYVLTVLMENQQELQNEHAGASFHIVTTLYDRILKPLPNDSLIDNRLIVAVCNFAWEIIVWNQESILTFFKSGSLFSLIDILERSPFSVQLIYLSMLADLCEHQQCIPYIVSWRGREGVKLLNILCNIWRAEEERLQVPRSKMGCISDLERPLMGEHQNKFSKQEKNKCVSIYDIFGSARTKIYAIVQLLNRHEEVRDLCEEHYRLGHDKVSYEDRVTLQIIKAYLPLKMGEIWWEIRNKQQTMLPLDRYLAEQLAERYLNWSLCVQNVQLSIFSEYDLWCKEEEQKYYDLIRSSRLSSALEALRKVVMIALTADRQILLRSEQRLRKCIEDSRAIVDTKLNFAYPSDIKVILFSNNTQI